MIHYPAKISFGDFHKTESVLEQSAEIDEGMDVDLSEGSQQCSGGACAIETLQLKSAEGASRSFTDKDACTLKEGMSERFYFAPGMDEIDICFDFENPDQITEAKLQIFSQNCDGPICVHELNQDEIDAGKITWNGAFGVEEKNLKKATNTKYPHALPTVDYSPYLVAMTIDGTKVDDKKKKAWTVFDVLVHEIKLSWGKPDVIPLERSDLATPNNVLGTGDDSTFLQKALLEREKRLFKTITDTVDSPDSAQHADTVDIVLDTSVFHSSLSNPESEFLYMRDMWGDGPMLPIYATVRVKNAAGEGCDAPKALGKSSLLWEWRDNDGADETVEKYLNGWLGPEDSSTASKISRNFLKKVFTNNYSETFPLHRFNCPAKSGGKRGSKHPLPDSSEKTVIKRRKGEVSIPPGKIFPEQSGDLFPFKVTHQCEKRTWTAISMVDITSNAVNIKEEKVHSGILFQPAPTAGDRYKLSVHFVPGDLGALDIVGEDTCIDLLEEAKNVPHAVTPYFHIYRKIDSEILYTTNKTDETDTYISYIQEKFKKELGYNLTIGKRELPEISDGELETKKKIEADLIPTNAKYLYLHFAEPVWKDVDYAFKVKSVEELEQAIENAFKNNKIISLKTDLKIDGRAIMGSSSGARGVAISGPGSYTYQNMKKYLVLMLSEEDFTDSEEISIYGTGSEKATISEISTSNLQAEAKPEVTLESDTSLRSRDIKVEVEASGKTVNLYYSEGVFRPTRKLSDARKQQIDELLYDTAPLGYAVKVIGKRSDNREIQRAQNVKDYIEQRLFTRQDLLDEHRKGIHSLFPRYPTDEEKRKAFYESEIARGFSHMTTNFLYDWAQCELKLNADTFENDKERIDKELRLRRKLYFFHSGGFSGYDKKLATGAMDTGKSTEQVGLGRMIVPPEQIEYKRRLKDEKVTTAHEFGHSLNLKHAAPTIMDSKPAPGNFQDHLAHDRCIMNYDPDTESFCAGCILRKRGWYWKALTDISLGHQRGNAWVNECKTAMEDEAKKSNADPAKIRLSYFMLDIHEYNDSVKNEPETAEYFMERLDSGEAAFIYRNLIYFYSRLNKDTQSDADQKRYLDNAEQNVRSLLEETTSPLDIDDVIDGQGALKGNIPRCIWNMGKSKPFVKCFPLMDINRDGNIESCEARHETWESGIGNRGVIIPRCSRLTKINADGEIDSTGEEYYAPVVICMVADDIPARVEKWNVTLSVPEDKKEFIRILDSDNKELLDGTTAQATISDLDTEGLVEDPDYCYKKDWEYKVYATRFAGEVEGFDGKITLSFSAAKGRDKFEYAIEMRVAPWMMNSNIDETIELCINKWDNAIKVREKLGDEAYLGDGEIEFVQIDPQDNTSPFMQDILTSGYSTLSLTKGAYCAFLAPSEGYNQNLVDHIQKKMDLVRLIEDKGTTFDSMGNLECTPPVKEYPYGRIFYGRKGSTGMADAYVSFFEKQGVQYPIALDTTWLKVGHVDEIITFIPCNNEKKFKMLVASAKKAYELLEHNKTDRVLLYGKEIAELKHDELTRLLKENEAYHKDTRGINVEKFLKIQKIKEWNLETCQPHLDENKATMRDALDLDDEDIIEVPLLYLLNEEQKADALIPCCVNLIVINDKCIIPQPYGPILDMEKWTNEANAEDVKKYRKGLFEIVYSGNTDECKDAFWEHIKTEIGKDGNEVTVLPIDTWVYLTNHGQIHCATNVRRAISPTKWWEKEETE